MSWDLVKACTVAIATPEGNIQGTGFFISPTGHLLTCAHVVESVGGWEKVRINGQKVELIYLGAQKRHDFAILQLPGYQGKVVTLSLSFEPGNQFRSIGYGRSLEYPKGATIEGSITDANHSSDFDNLPMLRLRTMADSQEIIDGYSGSPVFDIQLQAVVGMIAAFDGKQGGLAVPLSTVQENWPELTGLLYPEIATELEFPFFDEAFYNDCYKEIKKPGALIRLQAPLQWGKTYLMTQILYYGTQQGYQAVRVDFQEPEKEVFNCLKRFLQWFCGKIAGELNLPYSLTENWQGVLGANSKCTNYFEKYLLPAISSSLILGLDNVDVIFSHEKIAGDFLPLLRTWHENAKSKAIWKKLRLVIAYSKEEYILGKNKSPFNVGMAVEIPELNQGQVQNLVQHLKLGWNEQQVTQLMEMVGGHPWLVKKALYKIARREMTLKELLQIAPTDGGLYGDHLYHQLSILQQDSELLTAMKQVADANTPIKIDIRKASKLRNMRLVKYSGNCVTPLCDLYRQYFCDYL
ncbi:AAA-like domain-containing protein [Nostoc sp. CENA67]|uniref:AAA-like domain-containing protein n=1 Tax=Amazonocrinis nigriterrae CENA67 TaxID=2794033 RepID=A0A8J7HLY4_9NOST|nr:AAA-like domain-containing protein [Amazonocrinis nigriterrae]MBH8562061.1 AAA-like domain-containing protein [Amazonocrinis nigriterrae CENA67]